MEMFFQTTDILISESVFRTFLKDVIVRSEVLFQAHKKLNSVMTVTRGSSS